ncbi:uncharacterized protein LOC143277747 [Babylonia areolata]|uniref:uncharacterized protein LOC143277747 n=1 Tax=Babylonia areolata TaxID=304850 RepID=UPI003FD2D6D7
MDTKFVFVLLLVISTMVMVSADEDDNIRAIKNKRILELLQDPDTGLTDDPVLNKMLPDPGKSQLGGFSLSDTQRGYISYILNKQRTNGELTKAGSELMGLLR